MRKRYEAPAMTEVLSSGEATDIESALADQPLAERICVECGQGWAPERDYMGKPIHEGCKEKR